MMQLDKDVKNYEPQTALYGGNDGLDEYRHLSKSIYHWDILEKKGKIFLELGKGQEEDVKKIDIPTLILYGSDDEIVPIDSVNYVYDNIKSKSVTLIELEKLNHDLFINNRYEEVKKIIINFLINYNLNIKEKKKM